MLACGAAVAVAVLLGPKVLSGPAAEEQEGDSSKSHEHRGVLPPFKLGPIQNFKELSAAELETLAAGKLVMRQEEDPTRGKGLAVRDMAAKPEDVMQELVDFKNYAKKVSMCSKSTVYARSGAGRGKERVKVEMSSTILPGWYFNCYFDHTVDVKGRSMIWSLDYDKRSDLDDVQGMWYVAPHPSKEGWSRVYYQIDMRLRYKVPGVLYRALSKSSLSSAVSWVKDHSERRSKR